MKRPDEYCGIASCTERLVEVRTEDGTSVVVCVKCDNVLDWPSIRRGEAKIVK